MNTPTPKKVKTKKTRKTGSDHNMSVVGESIVELTKLWMDWMKNYNKSTDPTSSFKERRLAGEACERLVLKRYELIKKIDSVF